MAKVRVHELARAHDMSSKDVLDKLRAAGIKVKAPASAVDEDAAKAAIEGRPLPSNGTGAAKPAKAPEPPPTPPPVRRAPPPPPAASDRVAMAKRNETASKQAPSRPPPTPPPGGARPPRRRHPRPPPPHLHPHPLPRRPTASPPSTARRARRCRA